MKCWGDSKKLYRTKDEKKAIDNRYRASKGKEYWSNVSRTYHAKKKYGPLWESQLLVLQIFDECQKHMTKHEIRHKNKTLFKRAQRKARKYGRIERDYA